MLLESKRLHASLAVVMLMVGLVAGLLAATAHARKKDPLAACRTRCDRIAKEAQQKLQECTQACPSPSPGRMDEFQVCTQGCARKHNKPAGPSCVSKCESGELDTPPKKGQKKTHSEHKEVEPTHVRPSQTR